MIIESKIYRLFLPAWKIYSYYPHYDLKAFFPNSWQSSLLFSLGSFFSLGEPQSTHSLFSYWMCIARKPTYTELRGVYLIHPRKVLWKGVTLWSERRGPPELEDCISNAKIQMSEIKEILFLMEAIRERYLHKSLKLLLKGCEKGL